MNEAPARKGQGEEKGGWSFRASPGVHLRGMTPPASTTPEPEVRTPPLISPPVSPTDCVYCGWYETASRRF